RQTAQGLAAVVETSRAAGSVQPAEASRSRPQPPAQGVTADPLASTAEAEAAAELTRLQQAVQSMQQSLRDVARGVQNQSTMARPLGSAKAAGAPSAASVGPAGGAPRPGSPLPPAPADLHPADRPAKLNAGQRLPQRVLPPAEDPLLRGLPAARPAAGQEVGHAVEAARRSALVVSQVVGHLDDMSQTSRRIVDTLSLIDTIAFQTNLLALNAAVEAAHAGEQGKAARVVANDVKLLAQRAATAAREIKALIGGAVQKLDAAGHGLGATAGNGRTMDAIVGSLQCVTDIVGHIHQLSDAAAASAGTAHLSIEQLEQMNQQNSLLVSQSAGAAESLRVQAERLQKVVAAFRLLQQTQEAAWTAHSAIREARLSSIALRPPGTGGATPAASSSDPDLPGTPGGSRGA
ncbi:MAG: hypothetical protein RL722_2394, partial [Pseudomonadota bacterium]